MLQALWEPALVLGHPQKKNFLHMSHRNFPGCSLYLLPLVFSLSNSEKNLLPSLLQTK